MYRNKFRCNCLKWERQSSHFLIRQYFVGLLRFRWSFVRWGSEKLKLVHRMIWNEQLVCLLICEQTFDYCQFDRLSMNIKYFGIRNGNCNPHFRCLTPQINKIFATREDTLATDYTILIYLNNLIILSYFY